MPSKESPVAIVQKAFPGIHEFEALDMVNAGKVTKHHEGVVLCQEGAIEDIFYIILDGEVEVSKLIDETEARVLKHLYQGDFFGEMALIHDAPRAATVKTVTPISVLEIRKNAFEYILRKNPTVSLAMVREVSSRLRENDELAIGELRVKAGELAAAYNELAKQEHTRKEFLTTIAHELRTPLTTANGFLQVIRMGLLQGDALKSALETVSENTQKVITLVNDILFLYEMDLILQDFKPTDIGGVVATAVEQQRAKAERSQVGLDLKIAPDMPMVQADARGLERVIAILLDNAIKFSPDGGDIHVEAGFEGSNVWVRVRDQGVGIPEEVIPNLFKRFFRLDEVNGHLFSGAGLGLSIAHQVIEQHGGKIEVESELGKGSTFTLRMKARSRHSP